MMSPNDAQKMPSSQCLLNIRGTPCNAMGWLIDGRVERGSDHQRRG
jgi:hypothetical protein